VFALAATLRVAGGSLESGDKGLHDGLRTFVEQFAQTYFEASRAVAQFSCAEKWASQHLTNAEAHLQKLEAWAKGAERADEAGLRAASARVLRAFCRDVHRIKSREAIPLAQEIPQFPLPLQKLEEFTERCGVLASSSGEDGSWSSTEKTIGRGGMAIHEMMDLISSAHEAAQTLRSLSSVLPFARGMFAEFISMAEAQPSVLLLGMLASAASADPTSQGGFSIPEGFQLDPEALEWQPPSFVVLEHFRFSYEVHVAPAFQSSIVWEAHQGFDEAVPAFLIGNVCVRDLSSLTPYAHGPDAVAVPRGQRLELLSVGFDAKDVHQVSRSLTTASRFFLTNAASSQELGDLLSGISAPVTHIGGTTLFSYDGHPASVRCPDCSNIMHHIIDDLLLDVAAWRLWRASHGPVQHVVLNLMGSFGHAGAKAWFRDVLDVVVKHLVAPEFGAMTMQRDEALCFDRLGLTLADSTAELPAAWRRNVRGSAGPLVGAIAEVRGAVAAAFPDSRGLVEGGSAPHCPTYGLAYGRQTSSGGTPKPRRWLNFMEVVEDVRANTRSFELEVVDFLQLTVEQEVRLLARVDLLLSSAGAHWAKALFLRPGTLWLEPVCPGVTDKMMWFHPEFVTREGVNYGGMGVAFGLRYIGIDADGCPPPSPRVKYHRWVPLNEHPLVAASARSTISASPPALCVWRRAVRGLDLTGSAAPLARFAAREVALHACAELGNDCFAIRRGAHGLWTLRRGVLRWSDEPTSSLVRKEKCARLRSRTVWNVTGGNSCANSLRSAPHCEASWEECQRQCDSLPWCSGFACPEERAACSSGCSCRLCVEVHRARGGVRDGDGEVVLRKVVLQEAQTDEWLDWHSFNRDIRVKSEVVLRALDELGCGLLRS